MAQDAFGLASLYDPSISTDEAALQRQMALAQALRQQSLEAQGRTQMAGNLAIRNSPLEGVAKIVQALKANQLDSQNDASRQALSSKTMAAMASLLRGDQPGASPQQAPAPVSTAGQSSGLPAGVTPEAMTAGGFPQPPAGASQQPPPQAAPSQRNMNLAQLLHGAVANAMGGPAMGAAYAKQFEPTDAERTLRAANIDPSSPEGQKYMHDLMQKNAYIAPVNGRPGGWILGPDGRYTNLPQVPIGYEGKRDAQGNFSIAPVPGGAEALAGSEGVKARAKAEYSLVQRFNPATQQMEWTTVANVAGPPQQTIPQEVIDASRRGPFNATQTPDGKVTVNPQPAALTVTQPPRPGSGSGFGAAPPLGAEKNAEQGAKNRQDVMKDDYTALSSQSANAQTVVSRLQTIKQLGPQAITGAQSEKRDFFNGLLSLAGIKGAVDAKSAGDLIDKNAAQIALAIGAGSNGTDALRSLALTANPGRHMQLDAMQKAADSLIAPLQMTMAKNQLLAPHFTGGDTENYFTKKLAFEKAADPRVWELSNLPPAAQKAYVDNLTPAVAKQLLEARGTLRQLGALQ